MATVAQHPKVGDIVYDAYAPQRAGRVVALVKVESKLVPGLVRDGVRVRMLNGKEYDTSSPQDFAALVEDHRRKYEKFAALLSQLQAMEA